MTAARYIDLHGALARLQAEGSLDVESVDNDGDTWWQTSTQGNALTMAGFGKPITRKTADRLVAEVLERAGSYNADMELLTARRPGYDPFAYGKASGRTFNTFMDHLLWADTEVARHLVNRFAAININDPSVRPIHLPPEAVNTGS